MQRKEKTANTFISVVFGLLCLVWIYPIVMVISNSFKAERAITTSSVFQWPNSETYVGFDNFANALSSKGFLSAFWYSMIITVTSVVLILVCCSMCAWYITRVSSIISKVCYFLFVFSMVVPFQMLMFTLSALSDRLGLNTPYNICIIYYPIIRNITLFLRHLFRIRNHWHTIKIKFLKNNSASNNRTTKRTTPCFINTSNYFMPTIFFNFKIWNTSHNDTKIINQRRQ